MHRDYVELTWIKNNDNFIIDRLRSVRLTRAVVLKIACIITIINVIVLGIMLIHSRAVANKKVESFVKVFDNAGNEVVFENGEASAEYKDDGSVRVKINDKVYDSYNCSVVVREK